MRKKGGNRKLILQDLSVRCVSPPCSSSYPWRPRRRRSAANPCYRLPRSVAKWGTTVSRVERRTRKKPTLPCRSRSVGKGVSYRYGARGGFRGVCKTSWACAPFRRKNAVNEVLPPVRKRILILFGQKKRLRFHFQRFCGPPCRSFLRSRCESSPHRPTQENSSPLFGFAEYAYPPTPTKSAATPTASPTAW